MMRSHYKLFLGSGPTVNVLAMMFAALALCNRRHTVCITASGYSVVIVISRINVAQGWKPTAGDNRLSCLSVLNSS